jgi:outer membrane receptor protein involved in Fe transport
MPRVALRRQLKNRGSLNASYYSYVQQPSIDQLLPVTDNKNPLYEVRGNPDLKPALQRNVSFGYDYYDPKSGNNLWAGFYYGSTKHDIISITSYDEQLRQLTTYTNVNHNDNWSAYLSLGKSKKEKDYHWRVQLETNASTGRNHAFINTQAYTSHSYSVMARPMITYGYKDLFEINPSFRFNYQFNRYDIQALDNRKNTMYEAGFSGSLYWPSRLSWTTDLNYTHNSDVVPGFPKGYWLWNASVGYDFMKDKRATLEFSVFDLLDQNQTVRRSITDTYISDTQTMMLQRYFMVKLIYNLKKQPKKKDHSKQIYIF